MHIGTMTVSLVLAEAGSLKEKRQVIRGVVEGVRRKFNVSAAEVDELNLWRRATLGFAVVSNDPRHCNRVLDKVLDFLEGIPLVSVEGVELEVL